MINPEEGRQWHEAQPWRAAAGTDMDGSYRPDFQIHLPCKWLQYDPDDGDTITVSVTGPQWRIRLQGVDTPELGTRNGLAAKSYAESQLEQADQLSVQVYLPKAVTKKIREGIGVNWLNYFSFNRVPGYIWLDELHTLNQLMIDRGYGIKQ